MPPTPQLGHLAPARGHRTQRNVAQTRPKQQPPGDRLKTAKHHLNPDANPAKKPPPQRAEVTSLKPIKEKEQAPARGHKTQRNLAQRRPKQQPPGDRLKTSKHHLNPDANPAKNPPPKNGKKGETGGSGVCGFIVTSFIFSFHHPSKSFHLA